MAKASSLGGSAAGRGGVRDHWRTKEPQWERTSRWMFWRPAWRTRKTDRYSNGVFGWEYQTHKQRAKQALAEQFDPVYRGHTDDVSAEQARPDYTRQYAQEPRANGGGNGSI